MCYCVQIVVNSNFPMILEIELSGLVTYWNNNKKELLNVMFHATFPSFENPIGNMQNIISSLLGNMYSL